MIYNVQEIINLTLSTRYIKELFQCLLYILLDALYIDDREKLKRTKKKSFLCKILSSIISIDPRLLQSNESIFR